VRACAVETHVKISRQPLYTKIAGKMPQARASTLIKHLPLHLPQEPLSVDTLFGEMQKMVGPKGIHILNLKTFALTTGSKIRRHEHGFEIYISIPKECSN